MSPAGRLVAEGLRELAADPAGLAELRAILAELAPLAVKAAPDPAPVLFTARTLAAQIGVTDRTVRRAIQTGELRATERCGRWVIDADDAREWARQGRGPAVREARPVRIAPRPRAGVLAAVAATIDG